MINFETKFQYDNFCLEICQQNSEFVEKIIKSDSLGYNQNDQNKFTLCLSQKMEMTFRSEIIH